jgi:uncharacterized protein YlxW (UPF0749 family)
MVLCTFCSLSACKNCALKTRPFPQSSKDEYKRHTAKGTICKMCDRKFFIRKMINAQLVMIQANQTCIESSQKSLADQYQAARLVKERCDEKKQQKNQEIDELKKDIQALQDGLQSKGNLYDQRIAILNSLNSQVAS